MKTVTQLELKLIIDTGGVTGTSVVKSNGKYHVFIETKTGQLKLGTRRRSGDRLFSKIESAKNVLNEVGIKSFSVMG